MTSIALNLCKNSLDKVLLDRFCTFKCIKCLQLININSEDFELKEYTLCINCDYKYVFKKCSVLDCNNNYISSSMNDKCHIHSKVLFYDNSEVLRFLMDVVEKISVDVNDHNRMKHGKTITYPHSHSQSHSQYVPITKSAISKHNRMTDDDETDKSYKISFDNVVYIPDPIGEIIHDEDPSKYTCTGFTSTKGNAPCTKKAKFFNKIGKPVCGFHNK